ncbi:hypothetical protein N657DRAFT_651343 [Parathielavia appendiculata]|uniref:Uncharacterized protein n=1 Tax=Parathielavia appendiculata TaxID=2587402 RepID=A0AAN6TQN5_9PEZI|nr:hypothetical protein N657DRAFT_651343 [Parathielavia appendiculata]
MAKGLALELDTLLSQDTQPGRASAAMERVMSTFPASQLLLTRNAAVTWRVVGMVASAVCEIQKLVTRLALVKGTACISLAIRTSSDELCARSFA